MLGSVIREVLVTVPRLGCERCEGEVRRRRAKGAAAEVELMRREVIVEGVEMV